MDHQRSYQKKCYHEQRPKSLTHHCLFDGFEGFDMLCRAQEAIQDDTQTNQKRRNKYQTQSKHDALPFPIFLKKAT